MGFVLSKFLAVMDSSRSAEASVAELEELLHYQFKNKTLLLEALTHPSWSESATNYQRLGLVGEAGIGLIVSQFYFCKSSGLDPSSYQNLPLEHQPKLGFNHIYLLKAANLSTEKLARVAVRHGLFKHLRHRDPSLDVEVRDFAMAIEEEGNGSLPFSQSVKAPKVLAEIVESIAGAVVTDCNYDFNLLWKLLGNFVEPLVTIETMGQLPVIMLTELSQEQSMQVEIKCLKKETKTIAGVYVHGDLLCSCSSEEEEMAKINAAKKALYMLWELDISELEFDED